MEARVNHGACKGHVCTRVCVCTRGVCCFQQHGAESVTALLCPCLPKRAPRLQARSLSSPGGASRDKKAAQRTPKLHSERCLESPPVLGPGRGAEGCTAGLQRFRFSSARWGPVPHTPPATAPRLAQGPQGRGLEPGPGTGTAPGATSRPPSSQWPQRLRCPQHGTATAPAHTRDRPQPPTCLAFPTQKVMEWKWMKRPRRG